VPVATGGCRVHSRDQETGVTKIYVKILLLQQKHFYQVWNEMPWSRFLLEVQYL